MKISEAAKLWLEYHKSHSKESSLRAYKLVITQLCGEFGHENLDEITTERVLSFLNRITEVERSKPKKLDTPTYCHFSILSKIIWMRIFGIPVIPQC